MNGVERYYSTKNLMVFLAFLKVGWLQITAHFLYFKFVLACTFFFFLWILLPVALACL